MRINKISKKASAVIMIFAILLGMSGISEKKVTANAADSPAKMYFCDRILSKYGFVQQYNIYIQIDANSASNKAVYVHYNTNSNEWQDVAATCLCKPNNNTEIWKASISGFTADLKCAVKYVGDGQVYWDNNNGQGYSSSDVLGADNVIITYLSSPSPESCKITAILKNLGCSKTVTLRYTTDNWASYIEIPLSYSSAYYDTDYEIWTATVNTPKIDSFQYSVRYNVNGQTYWEHHF